MKAKFRMVCLFLSVVVLMTLVVPFNVFAGQVEYYLVNGTETKRTSESGFWGDWTGSSTLSSMPLTISENEGIIDFYFNRVTKLSGAANRLHQLWTPKVNTDLQNFIAGNKINYMTMRIKLSEPPTSNPYEHAIVAGNFLGSTARTLFLGELIRFCRPSGSDSPKIVLGGTPTTGTYEIYLVEGTGTELMSYSYNKWYTITFEINTEDPNAAVVKATVLDEETSVQTVSQPYNIATVDSSSNAMSINALRMMTYVGYGGLVGDNFHIYLDYIKFAHSPSYTLDFYRDSVAQENKITVLEPGNIVGNVVLEKGYCAAVQRDTLSYIMAAYRGDKMVGVDVKNVSDTEPSAELTVSDVQAGDIIKWYMWNDLGQIMPLEGAKRFDSSGLTQ